MTSPPEVEAEQLAVALRDLQKRFERIAAEDKRLTPGARALSEGVWLLLEELRPDAEGRPAQLGLLRGGLQGLADLLEAYAPAISAAGRQDGPGASDEDVDPMAQFREMFREEARRRLTALSISMMSIFNEWSAREALTESAAHLHAIRGAASMLGLDKIAKLTTLMEEVVLQMAEAESFERAWPTRALLRGVHLLDAAVADDYLELDISRTVGAMRALHAYSKRGEQDAGADMVGEAPAAPVDRSNRITAELEQVPPDRVGASAVARKQVAPVYSGALGKRILIVDDIETIAASVGFILSELEVPIDMAENGARALEMLRERPYSLVVSDVDMPRMDGVTLTRMVREDPAMSEIPVILLTSLDRPDERDAGIEAGATDYVIKGTIGGGELLNRVKELLVMAPDVPAGDYPKQVDRLRVLIAEDVETIAASIAFVLSEGPFDIEIAENGALALSRLRRERYDLLLSDVEMPEMGGLELLEAVRADDALVDLPVILLTSLQNPEVQQHALNIGADRFLIKGEVGGDTLRHILEDVAKARAEQRVSDVAEVDLSDNHIPSETPSQ